MKIVNVITTIELGGAEVQLLQTTKNLRAHGIDVSVVFLKGQLDLYSEFSEIGCELINLSGLSLIRQTRFLRRFTVRQEQSIVHAHLSRSELLTYIATLFTKVSFVITRHNSEPFWPNAPRIISSFLSRLILNKASRVIVISKAVLEFLVSSKEIRVDLLQKVCLIYYGFSDSKKALKRAKDSYKIVTVGTIARLEAQKDLGTLLKAVSRLTKVCDVRLDIVGEGSQKTNLENLSREIGIKGVTRFLGKTTEIEKFLSSLDVFVLPSKYEGFGAVLVEAMKVGVPIVASNTSSIPEVLGEDYIGLCVVGDDEDFARTIFDAINPSYRNRFTRGYRKRLSFFKAELTARKHISIYNSVLGR